MSTKRAVAAIMRAVRVREFGGPGVLKVETDVPKPTPQGKQILLRVHAAGINPEDTYIRSGTHLIKPSLPYTPGNDGAGVVAETGPEVTKFEVGLAACQIGRALGLRVFGTAGTEQGVQTVLSNGAEQVFNHRKEGYVDELRQATQEKGFNVIVEMLANVNLENDLKLAAFGGRVAVVGSRGTLEMTPCLTMTRELAVLGVQLPNQADADFNEADAFLKAGQECGWLRPVVGHEYTLEEAEEAHEEVIAHAGGTKGKLVFKI